MLAHLATPDCTGIEILDNPLYGGKGEFVTGTGQAAVLDGNRASPYSDAKRPQPSVPSIYEWQCRRLSK